MDSWTDDGLLVNGMESNIKKKFMRSITVSVVWLDGLMIGWLNGWKCKEEVTISVLVFIVWLDGLFGQRNGGMNSNKNGWLCKK